MIVRRWIALTAILLAVWPLSLYAADEYVGPEACRICHETQYQAWKKGPHSESYYKLSLEKHLFA